MRPKLFVDFDGTIVDSISAVCKVYDNRYSWQFGYTKPNPFLVNTWNFADQCHLLEYEEVEDIFGSQSFFNYLQPYPNVINILKRLKNKYQIIIVSIGTYENISLKSMYIKEHLPFIDDFIGIVNSGAIMDKSIVNMAGTNDCTNIFIDDNENNLYSQANTPNLIRCCYGKEYQWNEKWKKENGRWLYDWEEVYKELMKERLF